MFRKTFHLLFACFAVACGPACKAAEALGACSASLKSLRADGSDNAAALRQVLTQCAGTAIQLPAGNLSLSPHGFEHGFDIAAGTFLRGVRSTTRQPPTVFHVEGGGTYDSLFWVRNASHVRIEHIAAEGSFFASGCEQSLDYGHAVYVRSDRGSHEAVSGIRISHDSFKNFNGLSWVTVSAADDSPGVSRTLISGNDFISDEAQRGGCEELGIAYSVSMIALHGSDDSAHGLIRKVSIVGNRMHAGYVKQGIAIWSGSEHLTVRSNKILDAGAKLQSSTGELGRYAILIYNSAHERADRRPYDIVVERNVLKNPISCGVYIASGRSITVRNNDVTGQRDPNDAVLPKGAIALNHAESSAVIGNLLSGNRVGIAVAGGTVSLARNIIKASPEGTSVKISDVN